MDELCSLLIRIRLGIQPNTRSSSRSRAEVQQDGAALLLCCSRSLIDILAPIHADHSPPVLVLQSIPYSGQTLLQV